MLSAEPPAPHVNVQPPISNPHLGGQYRSHQRSRWVCSHWSRIPMPSLWANADLPSLRVGCAASDFESPFLWQCLSHQHVSWVCSLQSRIPISTANTDLPNMQAECAASDLESPSLWQCLSHQYASWVCSLWSRIPISAANVDLPSISWANPAYLPSSVFLAPHSTNHIREREREWESDFLLPLGPLARSLQS